MPEGDSVLRTARQLDALTGGTLRRAELRWPSAAGVDLTGRRVLGTRSVGKHLLTRFDRLGARPALTLHSHLRMDGSWRVRRAGSRAVPGPRSPVRAVLETDDWLAVGFSLGMLDVVRTEHEDRLIGHLGPDVLGPGWDAERALERLLGSPSRPIGDALLDQRMLAGLGTYWVSEALHLHGIAPTTQVGEVAGRDALLPLLTALPGMLGVPRRPEPLVYGRRGGRCRRCGGRVDKVRVGSPPSARDLFRCDGCQGATGH